MRLKIPFSTANEELIVLVNEGYEAFGKVHDIRAEEELPREVQAWCDKAAAALDQIFPTKLERNVFLNPEIPYPYVVNGDGARQLKLSKCRQLIRGLRGTNSLRISHENRRELRRRASKS